MEDTIDLLLKEIEKRQSKGGNHFAEGLFPSFRSNSFLFYKRPDTNVFFTANIVFILQQLKSHLSEKYNSIIDKIISLAIRNYPDFQNKDGLKTYNFWQTKPSNHFPNGNIFKRFEHFRIPDDIDDTALVYLTLPYSRDDVLWLKEKLTQHANLEKLQIRNTFEHYRNLKVYSTWFGKNMPIEFDVCALCNLMYLIEKHCLPRNDHDTDTYRFLREVIERNEFMTDPFTVAHNYATTPLIIYHYARLLGDFSIPELDSCREKLIHTIKASFEKEKSYMNKIILETSLIKLGIRNLELGVSLKNSSPINHQSSHNFPYFIAGLLSSYENPILQKMARWKITQMEWTCEAHSLALILENYCLKMKSGISI